METFRRFLAIIYQVFMEEFLAYILEASLMELNDFLVNCLEGFLVIFSKKLSELF